MYHGYEQQFGDIQGLPAKKSLFFPNHWWSSLTVEWVRPYNVFQNLGLDNVKGRFSTERF